MSLLKSWKNYRRNRMIRRHYGSLNPTHANVIGGAIPIRVDPNDGRARKILLLDTIRGRDRGNQAFWFFMLKQFRPTVCLDVGLNYGECLLAGRLPEGALGYGFEANPRLKPFVDETLAAHPDAQRMTLVFSPVADTSGQPVTLHVNPNWSGGSFVGKAKDNAGDFPVAIETITVTVDEQVPRPTREDRLLFKIDVEGFEPAAFKGMDQTIGSAGRVVGFTELSPEVLEQRGADVDAYWRFLAERFSIYACTKRGEAVPIAGETWSAAQNIIQGKHGDLILIKGLPDSEEQALLTAWRGLAPQA